MPVIYAPKILIEEMDDIMDSEGLTIQAEAMRKMAGYSKYARGLKGNIAPVIPNIIKTKKQKRSGIFPGGMF